MSIPNNPINGLYLTTTPIQYDYTRYGEADEFGTGFFFRYEGTTYLITNRHLVDITTHNGNKLNRAKIRIRPDPENLSKTERVELTIYDNKDGERFWKPHNRHDIDLVTIPLRPPVTKNKIDILHYRTDQSHEYGNIAFRLSDLPGHSGVTIQSGSEAIILGCPPHPTEPFYPIARNATISTVYGQEYNGNPLFQTDAASHAGLSGSPVLTPPHSPSGVKPDKKITVELASTLMVDASWHLIGVHAGITDIRQDLELNDSYYSTLLRDILNS